MEETVATTASAPAGEGEGKAEVTSEAETLTPVTVLSLSGGVLAEVSVKTPVSIRDLKAAIAEKTKIAVKLQKLVKTGEEVGMYEDGETLPPEGAETTTELEVALIVDETPLCYWNVEGNPSRDQLKAEGGDLTCPNMRTDFINVFTQEPIRTGRHYFQFVMHHMGDEQWCGVSQNEDQAGSRAPGRSLKGWSYYCGRMNSNSKSLIDGMASLQAPSSKALKQAQKPKKSGNVIGMALDVERGVVAFDLDGEVQGAMALPKGGPLHIFTHVDTDRDHVELRRPPLSEAPEATMAALEGEVLDGEAVNRLRC